MTYLLCFVLFAVGIYGLMTKKNLIKRIISLIISSYAVSLFLVLIGYKWRGQAPIVVPSAEIGHCVDPMPQFMGMMNLVVSLCMCAVLAAVCIRIYGKYKTLNLNEMNDRGK